MNNAEQIGFWYDDYGDILTVPWEHRHGYYIDSNDDRVQVRIDSEGNAIGFMVQGFSAFKDKSLEIRHGMDWWNQLGKDKKGSRPRCVLLTDSNRVEVSKRLIHLVGLPDVKGPWNLSRDSHYQLSDRFAWSCKLASLGIPVVLVYLGFLNAQDMSDQGKLFRSYADWERTVTEYGKGVVDNDCWGRWLDVEGTPFLPLIRTSGRPFTP